MYRSDTILKFIISMVAMIMSFAVISVGSLSYQLVCTNPCDRANLSQTNVPRYLFRNTYFS